jgi:DICT domain-containing protein
MVSRLDKKFTNEHGKYNEFDKYKSKVILEKEKATEPTLVADISQKDIDASKMKGYSAIDLETARSISNNPTLTQAELDQLKKAAKEKKKLEPTGKFKKE